MWTSKKVFWVLLAVLLAGSIAGIGYNIWFLTTFLRATYYPTDLQEGLFIAAWFWLALTVIYYPVYAFGRLLKHSARARSVFLHVLAFVALVVFFYCLPGLGTKRGYFDSGSEDRLLGFAFSSAYMVSFAYWRFTRFMRSRNAGKTLEN